MRRLLIFLRHPRPGAVKTRLAAGLGARAACAIYRASVELTLRRMRPFLHEAVFYVDPPEAARAVRAWLGAGWRIAPQAMGPLGGRLAEAVDEAFGQGASRVITIGTDAPWLRPPRVARAFSWLRAADAVVGPAQDGGYYLIGLSRPAPELFTGIPWGSAQVLAATRARARSLGLRLRALPRGYDLDRPQDVRRFVAAERRLGRPPRAVATMEACLGHPEVPWPGAWGAGHGRVRNAEWITGESRRSPRPPPLAPRPGLRALSC